jgi:predicted Zn finger-like uncharacterized protein
MNIVCPGCGYSGSISDKLIPDEGRSVKCPKCKYGFTISRSTPPAPNAENPPISDSSSRNPAVAATTPTPPEAGHLPGLVTAEPDPVFNSDEVKRSSEFNRMLLKETVCPKCGSVEVSWDKKGFDIGGAIIGCFGFTVGCSIAGAIVGNLLYNDTGTFVGVFIGMLIGAFLGMIIGGLGSQNKPVRFCRNCANRWEISSAAVPIENLTQEQKRARRKSTTIAIVLGIPAVIVMLLLGYCAK